jgi:mannosyltransferase
MRLDTDSYIFEPLCYDPIQRFHQNNRTYAYREQTVDPEWVTHGMWDFIDDYARTHPVEEATMEKNGWVWPAGRNTNKMRKLGFPTYYNNFEIVRLEAFRRPDVQGWLDELMSVPERVLKYRWGVSVFLRFLDENSDSFCDTQEMRQSDTQQ